VLPVGAGLVEPRVSFSYGRQVPFDAVLVDAGGVLIAPDPVRVASTLERFGVQSLVDTFSLQVASLLCHFLGRHRQLNPALLTP
jgi:hypothetical protein